MRRLTSAANAKLRTAAGECLLNRVAGHCGKSLAAASLLECRSRTIVFEDSKGGSLQEMLTFGVDGAVESRERALIWRRTREMRSFDEKWEKINEIWSQTEFLG
jgi:hypothetical protein